MQFFIPFPQFFAVKLQKMVNLQPKILLKTIEKTQNKGKEDN